MGRNDRKHSADAKAAVVHAYEQQGMTAEQIVTLAAEGQLKAPGKRDRCRPFQIAESTVKEYARLARRRAREASTNGGHDPDYGTPPVAATATVEKPQPRARPGQPLGQSGEGGSLLARLVNEANTYLAAVEAGLRCECAEPDIAGYDYGHGPLCRHCTRPAQGTPQSPRGAPPPP